MYLSLFKFIYDYIYIYIFLGNYCSGKGEPDRTFRFVFFCADFIMTDIAGIGQFEQISETY